jgi:hypothetical protein
MANTLFAIGMASLEMGLLHAKLQGRASAPDISTDMRNSIAMRLPEVAAKKRDLDRLFISMQQGTFRDPPQAVLDAVTKATEEVSNAIAIDAKIGVLLGLAATLVEKAKALE